MKILKTESLATADRVEGRSSRWGEMDGLENLRNLPFFARGVVQFVKDDDTVIWF